MCATTRLQINEWTCLTTSFDPAAKSTYNLLTSGYLMALVHPLVSVLRQWHGFKLLHEHHPIDMLKPLTLRKMPTIECGGQRPNRLNSHEESIINLISRIKPFSILAIRLHCTIVRLFVCSCYQMKQICFANDSLWYRSFKRHHKNSEQFSRL